MTSFIMLDTLKFAERLQEGGFTQEQARAQARAIAEVMVDQVASRQDITDARHEFKQEITDARHEFKQEITDARHEFRQEIADARHEFRQEITELRREIAEVKSSTIQWVIGVVLSVGILQTAVVTALILRLVH